MENAIDLTKRSNIKIGLMVEVSNGEELYKGVVVEILSKSGNSAGVKVRLSTGEVGHVKRLVTRQELRVESFKFWNRFLSENRVFSIFDNEKQCFLEIERVSKLNNSSEIVALLFDSYEEAKAFLEGSQIYTQPRYTPRPIKRNKLIVDHFKKTTHFLANNKRKIAHDKLKELEYKLRL